MSSVNIAGQYYGEWSVNVFLEALELSDKLRALEEEAATVPYSRRSPEFTARLNRLRKKAGESAETTLFLLGDQFLRHIQEGILKKMEEDQ